MTNDGHASKRRHAGIPMRSLAPNYERAQHETYVARLEAAIADLRNRNIAVTGSYGTGKSSILDEFCQRHGTDSVRLTISTLGSNDTETLPNRLQKEVVKQLLYSAKPPTVRNSRFKRIRAFQWPRAIEQSVFATLVVGLLLYLTGFMPTVVGTEPGRPAVVQFLAWTAAGVLAAAVLTVLRLITFDRFVVSTIGGALTLREDTSTYFDDYLDEIVHYFDTTDKRVVIFEDLDRFDNAKIFEALRELNTILNNTEERRSRGVPLTFIYAVKDSLFERLGRPADEAADPVIVENQRANRTKFFDLVIPVVPFISHRNARELLSRLLDEAGINEIQRDLVELVATHTTDMRLLVNLRNEYLVFAERLLDSDRVAPDLSPSNLFALVAYKMFHMRDFEEISRRRSGLDALYTGHRQTVRAAIEDLHRQRRDIAKGLGRAHSRADLAAALGKRLLAVTEAVARQTQSTGFTLDFVVDGDAHEDADVGGPAFWAELANSGEVTARIHIQGNQPRPLFTLRGDQLVEAFPDASDANVWADINERDTAKEVARIDADIARFRGAGFQDLLELSGDFADSLNATLTSELARDLVRRGYVTTHFATYAAQFYGDFTGVDVVTFLMQTVETNGVDIDYEFTTAGAVENLLAEAEEGFPRTVSVLNTDIVNHLLQHDDLRADDVARQIIERPNEHTEAFLTAYVTAGAHAPQLIARLARLGWPRLLQYLSTDDGVPDDSRTNLIDAALSTGAPMADVDLDEEVAEFVSRHHAEMDAFTTTDRDAVAKQVTEVVERLQWRVPELAVLSASVQQALIRRSLYAITPDNLRLATDGESTLSLDVLSGHLDVFEHCLAHPEQYLDTFAADAATPNTIETPDTLLKVLDRVHGHWSSDQLGRLLGAASDTSRLQDVRDATQGHWDLLAESDLVLPSLGNVAAFLEDTEAVEAPLAGLLRRAGRVVDDLESSDDDSKATRTAVAVAVINAGDVAGSLDERIAIVSTIDAVGLLPADQIDATEPTALASLLAAGLVDDTLTVFTELRPTTWGGMEAALVASAGAEDFATPALLEGFVEQILKARTVSEALRLRIVKELADFVADDNHGALTSAGWYAVKSGISLPLDEVRRVARASADQPSLTMRLLGMVQPEPTPDALTAVLAELGDPYARLATGGQKFEVPFADEFRAVFDQLKAAGRCRTRKKSLHDILQVWPSI